MSPLKYLVKTTIHKLPDDALLEIFHFYRVVSSTLRWWWKRLANVCRRWRQIIFASPHSLDLRLVCTDRTPTRTSLDDIWPPFPIAIFSKSWVLNYEGQDNIIVALEHNDRIIQIDIRYQTRFVFEKLSTVTQKPFPVLTDLRLSSSGEIAPVLHEGFLGGSAPRLRTIFLHYIAFPAFPKLASSAAHLSELFLWEIPITGYISPEAIATCLAALPSLKYLQIGFESPRSRPDRIGPPPPTCAVLPALIQFVFKGVSEYLEDLVARIDTPKLASLVIHLFVDLMLNIPQLHRFIERTERIRLLDSAKITFSSSYITIRLEPLTGVVELLIMCGEVGRQASSMTQVCSQLSPLLSHVEQLDIRGYPPGPARRGIGIDPTQWFELFDSFPAVQHLYIYGELRPLLLLALQALTGEGTTQALPTLRNLFFKGPSPSRSIREYIQASIAARQHSDHPVDVHWG
ncbi:hypothetical protein BJV74DRAFT_183290 [Russula compacta]|nr:hypothetical protein BJV74DRAFT_183290 [Russula compacta]